MTVEERNNIENRLDAVVASGNETFAVTPYNEYGQYAVHYLKSKHGINAIALDNFKEGACIMSYADATKSRWAEDTVILMASKYSDIRFVLIDDIKKSGLSDAKIVDLFLPDEWVEKDTKWKKKDPFKHMREAAGRRLLERIVRDQGSFFVFAGGGLGDTLAIACMIDHIKARYSAKKVVLVCKKGYQDIARMFGSIGACVAMERKPFDLVIRCGMQYGENWIIGYMPPGVQYRYKRRIEPYLCHILQLPIDSKPATVSRRFIRALSDEEKKKWSDAVIIAPYANTFQEIPMDFWQRIVKTLKGIGKKVYTNVAEKEQTILGTETLRASLHEVFSICYHCRGLISYRSGFSDVLAFNHTVRHVVINPGKAEQEYNDISVFGSKRVVNVIYDNQDEKLIQEIVHCFEGQ